MPSTLFNVLFAWKCSSTHHKLALDALRHLRHARGEAWRDFWLAHVETYLDGIRLASLDVDGDNKIDALTDGLLIVRYMLNIRGAALVAGAVNPAGSRTSFTAVETFLGALMP